LDKLSILFPYYNCFEKPAHTVRSFTSSLKNRRQHVRFEQEYQSAPMPFMRKRSLTTTAEHGGSAMSGDASTASHTTIATESSVQQAHHFIKKEANKYNANNAAANDIKTSLHEAQHLFKKESTSLNDFQREDKKDLRKIDSGMLSSLIKIQMLSTLIYQKLNELVSGDLVEESGLTEQDYHILLSHDAAYNAFVNLLAKALLRIETATNPQHRLPKKFMRSKQKKYIEVLKLNSCLVRDQIKTNQESRSFHPHQNVCGENEKKHKRLKVIESDSDEEEVIYIGTKSVEQKHKEMEGEDDRPSIILKSKVPDLNKVDIAMKGMKHETVGGDQKYHNPNLDPEVYDNGTSVDEKEYKLQKENDIRLCGDVKGSFRDIGFAKWSGGWQPVIQLGPFDAPSGPVRDEWMSIFDKQVKKERMPRLVYWYGTPHWENLTRAFSFIHHSEIISYDEGVKMGLNKFPNQKKTDAEMKLSEHEEFLNDGLEELDIELALPKKERVAWLKKKESYEFSPKNSAAFAFPFHQDTAVKNEINTCSSSLHPVAKAMRYAARPMAVDVVVGNDTSIFSSTINNENHRLSQFQREAANAMNHISSFSTEFLVKEDDTPKQVSKTSNHGDSNSDNGNQELLSFLLSQKLCIKGSPVEFFNWLVNSEDILSLADLAEALSDTNYVRESLQVGDGRAGLKGFKRNMFMRAVIHQLSKMKQEIE